MPLAEHCATPYRTSSNLSPLGACLRRWRPTYQKVEPMLRTHVPCGEPCLRCGKSHIGNPKGPLHSPHDDGGCYDRPHRHPLAVRSYSQPSRNRDRVASGLVFHRSRLRCSWSRCLTTFSVMHDGSCSNQHRAALHNALCAPSVHHRRDICEARRSPLPHQLGRS
jgi:hypothetical protein